MISKKHMSKRAKLLILIFCIVLLFIAWSIVNRYQIEKRIPQGKDFVTQIIISINEQTSLYKDHAEERALKEIKNCDVTKLTNEFEVSIMETYWPRSYEYLVTFDNQNYVIAEADYVEEGFILDQFSQYHK